MSKNYSKSGAEVLAQSTLWARTFFPERTVKVCGEQQELCPDGSPFLSRLLLLLPDIKNIWVQVYTSRSFSHFLRLQQTGKDLFCISGFLTFGWESPNCRGTPLLKSPSAALLLMPTSSTDSYLSPATGAWQVKGLQGGVGCPPGLRLVSACSHFTWEHLPALTLTSN